MMRVMMPAGQKPSGGIDLTASSVFFITRLFLCTLCAVARDWDDRNFGAARV